MKRTEAIQALRERFNNTDGTVLPPGLSIISQEEAAALGVFEDQRPEPHHMAQCSKEDGHADQMGNWCLACGELVDQSEDNDEWIEWGGGECVLKDDVLADLKVRNGFIEEKIPAGAVFWEHNYGEWDIIAYRIHRED